MEACYRCGATLASGIAWCGNCLAPQRRTFTGRPRLHPDGYVPEERRRVVHSRTRAGATTMTLRGRIIATVAVAGVFVFGLFTPFVLSFLIAYPVIAGILLRSIWKQETFSVPEGEPPETTATGPGPAGGTPRVTVIAAVAVSIVLGVVIAGCLWSVAPGLLMIALIVGLVVLVSAWFADAF